MQQNHSSEAYDPLWEARIYKDGVKVGTVKSIPLYSVINGFWIDETGNLEIVIRYLPQDWFEFGLKISELTFIACLAYLFYDWRKVINGLRGSSERLRRFMDDNDDVKISFTLLPSVFGSSCIYPNLLDKGLCPPLICS